MMPISVLTPMTVTIATFAFLAAFLVNVYNSGKIFGLVVTPKNWLPYVGVGIPFVSAVSTSLSSATALSAVVIFNALQAGLFALLSSAGGAGTHAVLARHIALPGTTKRLSALREKIGSVPPVVGMLFLLVLGGSACQACQGGPAAVTPSITLGLCILEGYSNTPSCRPEGGNWTQCVTVLATQCGSDAVSVESVLTAERKAAQADVNQ